ncbi:MAG: CDP-alcohol phosphatidyltransferase family protein [Candidatus Hodarchaeales archaeon]|jgi:phosphatidylglycerophosphate synthase
MAGKMNIFDDTLRNSKDQVLSKFYLRFWLRFDPNTISLLGFILGIFSIIFILNERYPLALIFWILNRTFDGLDGLVARTKGKTTAFGAYLDFLFDFFIYSFFIFALLLVNLDYTEVVIAGALLLCLYYVNSVSWAFLYILVEKRNTRDAMNTSTTEIAFPPALVEKGETIIFYIFFLLFSEIGPETYLAPSFLIFGGLILLTIIQRLFFARKVFTTEITVVNDTNGLLDA